MPTIHTLLNSHMAMLSLLLLAGLFTVQAQLDFPDNTPPYPVDVWCGKAYRDTDRSFSRAAAYRLPLTLCTAAFPDLVEAGWLYPPPYSKSPLLEFSCRPRLKPNIYPGPPQEFIFEAKVLHAARGAFSARGLT